MAVIELRIFRWGDYPDYLGGPLKQPFASLWRGVGGVLSDRRGGGRVPTEVGMGVGGWVPRDAGSPQEQGEGGAGSPGSRGVSPALDCILVMLS